ncbi:hypothetical protein GCM10011529_07050 [Polymorphobacter glacialis]|uniref:Uncharacterized protein n=1 Tax=Sandarakinorhabdus glacialis TaxID=1614636 RepID=A0A917E5Q2_9SPHN|nr:hypothetical protein [Polymorphobacter glacialis]GGE03200.1 hypothetical protein GCM10011529_07050 [Polymorphobacter glacialis]
MIIGGILRWIGRHLILFVLLLAALTAAAWVDSSADGGMQARAQRLEGAERELRGFVDARRGQAVTAVTAADLGSQAAVARRLGAARGELAALGSARPGALDMMKSLQGVIVQVVERDLNRAVLQQEIAFLEALGRNLADRGAALQQRAGYDARIAAQERRIAELAVSYAADGERLQVLKSRSVLDRYAVDMGGVTNLPEFYAERRAENLKLRGAAIGSRDALIAQRRMVHDVEALATPVVAIDALEGVMAPLTRVSADQRAKLEATLQGEARRWYQKLGIDKVLRPALWALAGIILLPLAIRTLFYWVLAPLASLQKPIRLLERAAPIAPPLGRSAVSKPVVLAPGEELLVKQGFVQTISHGGSKDTRLLLDYRYPVSSLASGLAFLTRVRAGSPGDVTTVSATRDAFAEVVMLALPEGGAAVLQPRALVGVVQAVARPMRITSHWRLGTLNAWLTWQLRFLVFHGPAQVILKGGRGVRIELARGGRSIGHDQLIGFSAGLAYSTGRTETFLPYLFGQEPLLKDRVAAGEGLLIAEEAPMAGRRGGVSRGLEGVVDAALKVFGI